ncbi:MAG: ATP-binding protein [Lentisphaerae bacterium]|nr:ATP-binding protein [Lentisphaerota bacterium]
MFTRRLELPGHSFFLLGPRGTGKTTWLRHVLPDALWFDLLRTQTLLALSRQPESFRQQIEARTDRRWVVVDEVQRLPGLLHEVHALIAERGTKYRFALSGSSARKLKRLDVDLLAGRAINRQFFPLTSSELGFPGDLDNVLRFGLLPQIRAETKYAVDALEAYVGNYIREEIQQEALVRNLDSFARFLEVAALMNGRIVNVSGIARDAAVARPTVQGYFSTLVDTLIGVWLPAWRKKAKVKEVASPKFYLFDPGVTRALAGRLREPLDGTERGFLLETWVLHELRAAIAFRNLGGQLHYWRTPSGSEVDFIWSRGNRAVGIEVKASTAWRGEYGSAIKSLLADGILTAGHGIYTGAVELKDGALRIWPLQRFFRELTDGGILA